MPSLPKGKHTIEVRADTKTEMGVITAKREVLVDDPAFAKLMDKYAGCRKQSKSAQAARVSKQLLDTRFTCKIRPGEPVALTDLMSATGKVPEGYSASVKWYPGPKSLRAIVEVHNPYYRAPHVARMVPMSYLQLHVCASGADQDVTSFHVGRTADGQAKIFWYDGGEQQTATGKWKSFNGAYVVDVSLPHTAIKGFEKSWTRMAVCAAASVAGPDCRYQSVCTPGACDISSSARSYCLLTRK